MAVAFSSDLIEPEPVQTHSPRVQHTQKSGPATTDASPQGLISTILPASSSVLLTPEPDSLGISSSSAAARQPRATHTTRTSRGARSPAASPSSLSLRIPEKPSKSRGSSFLNFFSVREPSRQAFEEYEKRMRAKGPTSDNRTVSGGMPGVSSVKMPATVPKVNSSWDGVPQVIKLKEKGKQSGSQAKLGKYSRSISTAGSDGSKTTAASTTSSDSGSVRLNPGFSGYDSSSGTGDIYGWESASLTNDSRDRFGIADVKEDHRGTSVSSRTRKRMALSSHPVHSPHVPENYLDTELPPLPSVSEHGSRGFSFPEREILPDTPAHSSSSTITSSESSPITPYDFSPMNCGSSRQKGHGTDQQHVISTTLVIPDHDKVIIRSAGVPILVPPASARRKENQASPFAQYEPEQLNPSDTPVITGQSEKAPISHMWKDPPLDSSTPVDNSSEPGPKTKRSKIPLLFGK